MCFFLFSQSAMVTASFVAFLSAANKIVYLHRHWDTHFNDFYAQNFWYCLCGIYLESTLKGSTKVFKVFAWYVGVYVNIYLWMRIRESIFVWLADWYKVYFSFDPPTPNLVLSDFRLLYSFCEVNSIFDYNLNGIFGPIDHNSKSNKRRKTNPRSNYELTEPPKWHRNTYTSCYLFVCGGVLMWECLSHSTSIKCS